MIEIKFDSNNEGVLVQHINQMLSNNPILLQNIIEPVINEIISDIKVPLVIEMLVKSKVEDHINSLDLDEMYKEIIRDNIDNHLLDTKINEYFDGDSFDDKIDDHIDSHGIDSRVDDIITETVADHMNDVDVETRANEIIEREVSIKLERCDVEGSIHDMVCDEASNLAGQKIGEIDIVSLFKEFLQANMTNQNTQLILESIRGIVKEEIEKQKSEANQKSLKNDPKQDPPVITPNQDASQSWVSLSIECRTDALPTISWLLTRFINDNMIRNMKGI